MVIIELRTTPRSIRIGTRVTEMVDLSSLFAERQSSVAEWEDRTIHALYEFAEIPAAFTVEFIKAKKAPVQGLHLKIRGGTLVANGVESAELVLWRDSAPVQVDVEVRRPASNSKTSLRAWNVWRGGRDVMQAWLGNAAIEIGADSDGRRITLCCSDGQGAPAFDDLVVAITTR